MRLRRARGVLFAALALPLLASMLPWHRAEAGPGGYRLLDDKLRTRPGYVIRLHGVASESHRTTLGQIAGQLDALTSLDLTVAAARTASTSAAPGEILVEVSPTSSCAATQPAWIACTDRIRVVGPDPATGLKTIESAHIVLRDTLASRSAQYRFGTIAHEMGHSLGLAHYDAAYNGRYQLMHTQGTVGSQKFEEGDLNGLAVLTSVAAPAIETSTRSAMPGSTRGKRVLLRSELSGGPADKKFNYMGSTDKKVVGDWNGDGKTTIGVVTVIAGQLVWRLRNDNSTGPANKTVTFGRKGDRPIVGDWNGDGADTIGVVRGNVWMLRNQNKSGNAQIKFPYGSKTDTPIAGDWDGDGRTTPGLFKDGWWSLKSSNTRGAPDIVYKFGQRGDRPIVGDWDGNGTQTPGLVTGNIWRLRNSHTSGTAAYTFTYGDRGDKPLVGDWNGPRR